MERRQFFRLAAGAVASATMTARGEVTPAVRFGVCAGIDRAAAVKAAGGEFLEASVQALLVPDADDTAFAKQLESLRAAELPVAVCNGFIRRPDLVCVGPQANHDAVIEHVAVSIRRAARAGVKTIVFGSAGCRKRPEGFAAAQAVDQMAAVLRRMGTIAGDAGVVIAVEPLNAKECNFLNRIGEVAEVVARAGHPAIQCGPDFYHMILGGDTPEDLRKVLPAVQHVELADPKGRGVPIPGGHDFSGFFRVLREAKFAGTVSIETRWSAKDLEAGIAELRRQWKTAAPAGE